MEKFQFEKDFTFINHGSYGATPKIISETRDEIETKLGDPKLTEIELYDKQWEYYRSSIVKVSEFLKIGNNTKVVIEHNTTGAWNRILQFDLAALISKYSHKKVFRLPQSYGAMLYASHFWMDGPEMITMEESKVVKNDLAEYFEKCDSDTLPIFLFDMIHSDSAKFYRPELLSELVKNIRRNCENSIIVIDAAHAPGIIENLRIEEIDADYFIGNIHKWSYSSKTASFIHSTRKIDQTKFFERVRQSSNFESLATIPAAIDFYENEIGGYQNLKEHTQEILDYAEERLKQIGEKSERADDKFIKDDSTYTSEYPITMRILELDDYFLTRFSSTGTLMITLMEKYDTWAKFVKFDGKIWLRLSANIYNRKEDYDSFAQSIEKLLNIGETKLFIHDKSTNQLNTHTSVKSIQQKVDYYRNRHNENPDRDMRVERRRLYNSACQWVADHLIGGYSAEKIGLGIEGSQSLLDMLVNHTKGTNSSQFTVSTDLSRKKLSSFSERTGAGYLVIDGSEAIGSVSDSDIKSAIDESDVFIAAMDGYLMGPKGLALMVVNNRFLRENFHESTISWNFLGEFQDRMEESGTRD